MTREERKDAILFFKQVAEKEVNNAKYSKLAIEALQTEPCEDMGEVSDGYHTFNQLYHQRAVLFACIVNQNKEKAWKSFKHSDGKYCFDSNGEWFIVGVDTPQGSYTYHYAKEYWNMFECKELECGKKWDGHTEEDVTRLLSLPSMQTEPCEDCVNRQAAIDTLIGWETDPLDEDIERELRKLPSVQPAQKTGKWKRVSIDKYVQHASAFYRCSECGRDHIGMTNFCSNCGTEMEVEHENS